MSKTQDENHRVSTESPHRYFHMMLNMAEDDLNPYEYRLLGHFIRQTGHGGLYEMGIRAIAKRTRMSVNRVRIARAELAKQGYLEVTVPTQEDQRAGQPVIVKVVDRWSENIQRYSKGCVQFNTGGVSDLTQVEPKGVPDLTQGGVLNLTPLEEQLPIEEQLQEQKDLSPAGEQPLFSTIEARWGVGVGEDWLPAYWDQQGITPKKTRPRNLVFEAISDHVFGIPDTDALEEDEAKRVGAHTREAKKAFEVVMGTLNDQVCAEAIGKYKRHLLATSNGYKQPNKNASTFRTEFKAYLFTIKESALYRLYRLEHAQPPASDDSPLIDETRQLAVRAGLAALTAAKSGNSKPRTAA